MKRWCPPFGFHTRSFTNRFVCNFLSSSAGFNLCSCFFPAHPCLLLSLPTFSGPSIPRPRAASFPLSDLRCFRSLSVASVLGSDYSASALPFSSLHASASQLLPRCSFGPFVPQVLPLLSRLVSHPFLPAPLTQLCCSFPFALPCFAPTAVPQVLASAFSASRPLPFVCFRSASSYSALCSSFQFFPLPPHSGFPGAQFRSRFPVLLRSLRLISHASFRALSVPPCFLSSASGFPSQLLSFLALPFRFFPHSPRASSFGAPALLSSRRSPLPSTLVSHGFCPIPLTRFSASFSFVLPGSSPAADFPVLALLSASSRPLLP